MGMNLVKKYKNQSPENAKQNGFGANFAFASDKVMSPNGVDIMKLYKGNTLVHTEVTTYDRTNNTAEIAIYK